MKKKTSLSPRFQISLRNILKLKQNENEENKLETLQQMDQFFSYYQQEPQQFGLNTSRTSLKQDQQVNANYLEYFNKKQKETKQEAFTSILKSCSEYFINTLFIALIGEAINDRLDKIGTVSQVLISFGIQPGIFKSMDEIEKRDYIISKFNNTIDSLMLRWKDRVENRQQQLIITHVETKITPEPLKWLNIKTKYQSLQSQLAKVLYRKLDELSELQQFIKKKQMISLKDVTRPTILELIKRMDPNVGRLFLSLKESKQMTVGSKQRIETNEIKNVNQQMQYFQWNGDLEMAFQENRQRNKANYSSKITTCNFNVMGYLPLIQAINRRKIQDVDEKENEIIYEEIKFAKAFSKFLARCADKKQLQSAINLIDPDQISALEGNLAEHIIETHSNIVKMVQETRHKYLQSQTQKFIKMRTIREISQQRLIEKDKNKSELLIRRKRYNMIFKRNCFHNFFVFYFAKCIMKRIRGKRRKNQRVVPKANIIVKRFPRSSKSPEFRKRCITETSTGPILFRPSRISNKMKAILKIQSVVRRFLTQCYYRKVLKNKLYKLTSTYRRMISSKYQA